MVSERTNDDNASISMIHVAPAYCSFFFKPANSLLTVSCFKLREER